MKNELITLGVTKSADTDTVAVEIETGATIYNNHFLRHSWEVARLLSFIMPSSGAAGKVFSLLNNQFNQRQTRTLSDLIFLFRYHLSIVL